MIGSVESNTPESEDKEQTATTRQLSQPNHKRKLGRKVKKLDHKISANGMEKFKKSHHM